MRYRERSRPAGSGRGADQSCEAKDQGRFYIIPSGGARKVACQMRPEAGRRWHP